MKIGILGYGNVGKGVCEIIEKNFNDIEIVHICDQSVDISLDKRFTQDNNVLLNGIDVLLEMIVNEEPAHTIIMNALNLGIHVITSNKATVAKYLDEFIETANKNNVQFKFEASVGGGIPWIQSLIKAKRIDKITSCKGILNGTTNYILDKMNKNHLSFNDCLADAQKLGYAEANPTADIDGYDVQRKIMISSAIAFGGIVPYEEFDRLSLANIQLEDIEYFDNKGFTIKYVGSSFIKNNSVYGSVEPILFNNNHIFTKVDKNNNIVELVGDTIGTLSFVGQGAGRYPTANAMIQDLLDIKNDCNDNLAFENKIEMNKDDIMFEYIICSSQLSLNQDVFVSVENYKGRNIALTKPMTPQARNELINILNELDEYIFCIRKED